ncbi:3-isopropylmalate dehydratase, partial [bacterium]
MAQKILAARASDPTLAGDFIEAKVDQVVLAKAPQRAYEDAVRLGLKRTSVEVAVAYDGLCVTSAKTSRDASDASDASRADARR